MADEQAQVDAYVRRDQSLIGRVVNSVVDGWRTLTGNTPSWVLAADQAAEIERGKAAPAVQIRQAPVVPDFRWAQLSDLAEMPEKARDPVGLEAARDNEPDYEALIQQQHDKWVRDVAAGRVDEFKGWTQEEIYEWEDLEADDDRAEQQAKDAHERSQGRDPDASWLDVVEGEEPAWEEPGEWSEERADWAARGWDPFPDKEQDQRDILGDVKRQAHERAFGRGDTGR